MLLRRTVLGAPLLGLVLLHCSSDPPSATPGDAGVDSAAQPRKDAGGQPPVVDAGPDGQTIDPSATEGGSARFEARYNELKFEDGTVARSFLGFYDRALGTMCRVRAAGVDKFYCLPVTSAGAEFPQFLDASCSRPAVVHQTWWPYTVAHLDFRACDHAYYKMGAGTVAGEAYYKDVDGTCKSSRVSADETVYPITPIAMRDLGELTRVDETRTFPQERPGSRIVLRADRFTHPDGTFMSAEPNLYDLPNASRGEEALATDGVRRFIPARSQTLDSFFASDTCAPETRGFVLQVHTYTQGCSTMPERRAGWFQYKSVGNCVQREYHPRPSTTPLSTWWRGSDGTCSMATPELRALYDVYPPGPLTDEAPPATLAELTHRWSTPAFGATSGTQLVAKSDFTESADGLSYRRRKWQLFLKANDTPCTPTGYGPSGVARCRPVTEYTATVSELFSDAACTQKTIGALEAVGCDRPKRLTTYVRSADFPYPIYRYPTTFGTRAAVWSKQGNACVALTPSAGADYFDLSSLQVVPETEFPKVLSGEVDLIDYY
ncbi:MAG: hypothetical protein HOO96_30490 [Polyangiaceae bacterium]|nr:hypothetical protein [Polyangiaceae bacterium]